MDSNESFFGQIFSNVESVQASDDWLTWNSDTKYNDDHFLVEHLSSVLQCLIIMGLKLLNRWLEFHCTVQTNI